MIWPVHSYDCALTVQSQLLSSKTFSKSGLHDFLSVFGYILSFLDRMIVKSLKSTSTSEESRVGNFHDRLCNFTKRVENTWPPMSNKRVEFKM